MVRRSRPDSAHLREPLHRPQTFFYNIKLITIVCLFKNEWKDYLLAYTRKHVPDIATMQRLAIVRVSAVRLREGAKTRRLEGGI